MPRKPFVDGVPKIRRGVLLLERWQATADKAVLDSVLGDTGTSKRHGDLRTAVRNAALIGADPLSDATLAPLFVEAAVRVADEIELMESDLKAMLYGLDRADLPEPASLPLRGRAQGARSGPHPRWVRPHDETQGLMAMADEQSLIEDRIAGALLGVTVGDCLGAPLEFKSPDAIKQQWGEHRDIEGTGTFGHPPGVGTDDSDLTFAVARAYRDGFSLEKVADNFISWKRSGPRDVGGATAGGIARLMELRRRSGSELTVRRRHERAQLRERVADAHRRGRSWCDRSRPVPQGRPGRLGADARPRALSEGVRDLLGPRLPSCAIRRSERLPDRRLQISAGRRL